MRLASPSQFAGIPRRNKFMNSVNWLETHQLNTYKNDRGSELGSTVKQLQLMISEVKMANFKVGNET